ncbi:MAG: 2-oxoglutarate dehydrogenase complex dihydrolipoyllysine-residue succinyltransferase [Chloroflexi bacterium]|nr:MAG: 2-oxoglutarate dehydrogenase complex dihydrolipoyllysine-residue succinyltransferase [Chloroflexota bacterium]
MPVDVRVPVLGESVVEATVGAWLKHEGEPVEAGEALVQLETEKVNVDVAADQSGVLGKIAAREGETVHPGDVLATIDETARAAAPAASAAAPSAPQPEAPPAASETPTNASEMERPHASPVARRMAEEHGLDLARVEGTGTGGRVTREDVERHIEAGQPRRQEPTVAPRPAGPLPDGRQPAGRETRIRMSRRRQTIAARLLEAQRTAAMLTTFNEADMSAIMEIRARRREAFQKRHGIGLGFMSFFTKAVIGALHDFPNLNAEIRGDEIIQKHYYDIGIAVGAEGGLVVPVVRDADRKSFAGLEREIAELAEKARNNTLTLEDLRGGTFTITNGGVFGSLLSTPILSPPQVGILGMHRIQQRPVALDGQVVIRPMMYLALTYDHRLVDGREAVQFLVRIKDLVEDPTSLLLE